MAVDIELPHHLAVFAMYLYLYLVVCDHQSKTRIPGRRINTDTINIYSSAGCRWVETSV